jgi:hypothetical protein
MSDHNQDERAAPDEYENGPEGMPRVKRMPSAVLDCIIDHSLFRYLGGALEGEDRDRLYGLMHDTANEALARISAWPVAPAVGEDGLPPLPAPKYPQMKVLIHGSTSEQCGYTAEQYRQGQLDAVAAYKRKHAALQEMVDIAQECDMGYGAPFAYFHKQHGFVLASSWCGAKPPANTIALYAIPESQDDKDAPCGS